MCQAKKHHPEKKMRSQAPFPSRFRMTAGGGSGGLHFPCADHRRSGGVDQHLRRPCMTYTTVKRNSTAELVMMQILKSIESGQLKPGDKLPTEHQLSEMFGVGRSTVREATAILSMLGYLQSFQGKGCFVREDLDPVKATAEANTRASLA